MLHEYLTLVYILFWKSKQSINIDKSVREVQIYLLLY